MNHLVYPIPITLLIYLTCANITFGQSGGSEIDTNGIVIIQDERIPKLADKYLETQPDGAPGFRVQIFFTARKANALEVKTSFTEKFSAYEAVVEYDKPYFKVRAGAFRTKLQAERLLKLVKEEYPGSFVVDSNIAIEELRNGR